MNNTTELNNGLCEQESAQMEKEMIEKLHLQGCSIAEISQKLRLKQSIVRKHVEKISEEIECPQNFNKEQAMDLQRLNKLLKCWYPAAVTEKITMSNKDKKGKQVLKKDTYSSGLKAAAIVLRILDRRARLLGFAGKSVQESSLGDMTGEIPLEELEKQLTDEDRESLKGCFHE